MENTFPETTETPVQPFSSKLVEELHTTVSTEDTKTALRDLLALIAENDEDTIASLT
ncbi:hypothetical protein M8994_19680 [Brucella sp. 21LCYQ03]|nr:hypothetical protein [Brucella sp. 21LCYQ03]